MRVYRVLLNRSMKEHFIPTFSVANQWMSWYLSSCCVGLLMNWVSYPYGVFSGFLSLNIHRMALVISSPIFLLIVTAQANAEDVNYAQNVVRVIVMAFKPLHGDKVCLPGRPHRSHGGYLN